MPSAARKFDMAHQVYRKDIAAWTYDKVGALPGVERDDLEQEMLLVLWKAVLTYHPDNGSKFANYFRTLRDRKYVDLLRKANTGGRESEAAWIELDEEAVVHAIATLQEPSAEEMVEAIGSVREFAREIYFGQRRVRNR